MRRGGSGGCGAHEAERGAVGGGHSWRDGGAGGPAHLAEEISAASEAEAAAGEAAEEAAAAAMAEETGEAAEAAAVAEHMADEAANDTAVALVRSAHAGAWVAQHLSVYMRWASARRRGRVNPRPRHPRSLGASRSAFLTRATRSH